MIWRASNINMQYKYATHIFSPRHRGKSVQPLGRARQREPNRYSTLFRPSRLFRRECHQTRPWGEDPMVLVPIPGHSVLVVVLKLSPAGKNVSAMNGGTHPVILILI